MQNYYDILGVPQDASIEDIKAAYKKLAVKFHPDKHNGDKTKEQKFKDISNAYSTLKDSEKKSKYDSKLKYDSFQNSFKSKSGSYNSFESFSEPTVDWSSFYSNFGSFFQNRSNFQPNDDKYKARVNIPKDITLVVNINLLSAIKGDTVKINFSRKNMCKKCAGTTKTPCSVCNGTGQSSNGLGAICSSCYGIGYTQKCSGCYGKGFVAEYVETRIKIPKGIKNNSKLRLSKEGNLLYVESNNTEGKFVRGDVIFTVTYPNNGIYSPNEPCECDVRFLNISLKDKKLICEFSIPLSNFLAKDKISLDFLGIKKIELELKLNKCKYHIIDMDIKNIIDYDIFLVPKLEFINTKDFSQKDENKAQEIKKLAKEIYGEK